ncbi:major facilitator superfamily domain-containing protein [Mycena rebaudengoi]|nr:major facilitator superfamily domain-containing protein [Mycena rebaudengoi]
MARNQKNTSVNGDVENSNSPGVVSTHDMGFLPIPKNLRYNAERPFRFGLLLSLGMGFSSTFTVANLFYCQPLLINLSTSFGVSYGRVSQIPTLLQAGYAVGVVFISPLGDLVRRRQLILILLILSTAFTVGLAVTDNFIAFETLSFLVGVTSIITTILQPLAADLAPPERRATAISVVISGLILGVLVARVLAGILGQFSSWRTVYYFAIGVQALAFLMCYLLLPDSLAKNSNTQLSYAGILWTMAKFTVTEPALIQACLIHFAVSAAFTSFWVTLTFLLGGPLYRYSTLDIGLFGLVGMLGVLTGPFLGRVIDMFVPWYSTVFAILLLGVFNAIQMGTGGLSVAAIIIVAFGSNLFRQILQASVATTVLSISDEARGRLNAVNVMGTSVGSDIYIRHGWRACAALSVALSGWQLFILLLRGPHCRRYTWFGYEGGWKARHFRPERDNNLSLPPETRGSSEKSENQKESKQRT